jgi:hypothetical protein
MYACSGVFIAFDDTLTRVSNQELEENVEDVRYVWYNTQKCFKYDTPRIETIETMNERRCQSHSTGRTPT